MNKNLEILMVYKSNIFMLLIIQLISAGGVISAVIENDFVGAKQCAICHQQQFDDWNTSGHSKPMAEADKTSVLGNFSNIDISFHNVQNHFFTEKGKYWVKTTDVAGQQETHQIRYTF